MLITLKQKDIEAALRLYISQRGINLAGKDVEIAFTAGRTKAGLSAEVNIEDGPTIGVDFAPIPAVDQAATGAAVQAFNDAMLAGTGITMTSVDPGSITIAAVPPAQPDPTPEPEQAPAPPPVMEASKKAVSLFN